MTKEEAIILLKKIQQLIESTREPIKEAFDMAIEALEHSDLKVDQ